MARPRFDETDEEFDARSRRPNRWISYALLASLLGCCGMVFFPVWQASRPQAIYARALSGVKQAFLAALMYANDADDHLPVAGTWMDAVSTYAKDESCLHSPGAGADAARPEDTYGLAFRRSLSNAIEPKIQEPDKVALIFDSTDLRRNAAGELNLLPQPPRYDRPGGAVNVVVFVDGHAMYTPKRGVVLK